MGAVGDVEFEPFGSMGRPPEAAKDPLTVTSFTWNPAALQPETNATSREDVGKDLKIRVCKHTANGLL